MQLEMVDTGVDGTVPERLPTAHALARGKPNAFPFFARTGESGRGVLGDLESLDPLNGEGTKTNLPRVSGKQTGPCMGGFRLGLGSADCILTGLVHLFFYDGSSGLVSTPLFSCYRSPAPCPFHESATHPEILCRENASLVYSIWMESGGGSGRDSDAIACAAAPSSVCCPFPGDRWTLSKSRLATLPQSGECESYLLLIGRCRDSQVQAWKSRAPWRM